MRWSLFRCKSLSLLIGVEFTLYWLYFNNQNEFIALWGYISMYLFQRCLIVSDVCMFLRWLVVVLFKRLFIRTCLNIPMGCVRMSDTNIHLIGSTLLATRLGYSHNVLFRLFFGLMVINPVFLLMNLCQRKVLIVHSFYYEYSDLSIFGKQSTNANGHHLLYDKFQ